MSDLPSKEHRKVKRVILEHGLKVVIGSIGSQVRYDLTTHNVSHNGFFLDFEKPKRFPFTTASIMEVLLELRPGESISFSGKMARVVLPDTPEAKKTGPGIAIRVVQITPEAEKKLLDFIRTASEESPSLDQAS